METETWSNMYIPNLSKYVRKPIKNWKPLGDKEKKQTSNLSKQN